MLDSDSFGASQKSGGRNESAAVKSGASVDPQFLGYMPGERATIQPVSHGASPMVASTEEGFHRLTKYIKMKDLEAISNNTQEGRFKGKPPGTEMDLLELRDGSSFALPVPLALARVYPVKGDGEYFWVPLQYLRKSPDDLAKGEFRLPLFYFNDMSKYQAGTNGNVTLHNVKPGKVPLANEVSGLQRFAKAEISGDRKSFDQAIKEGAVFLVPEWSRATVVDDEPRPVSKRHAAIQVQLDDPTYEKKKAWVSLSHCQLRHSAFGELYISIRPYKRDR